MRVAVVGAGAWGKNIVRTLNEMDALGAVVEVSPTLREGLAESYPGLVVHDSIDPLLNGDIPAVCIATPVTAHYDVAKALLENGKDVFIEKPMTLSVADAEDLVATAAKSERVLMVGHLLLYQPAVQWIKSAIADGMVGGLRAIHQRRLGLGRAQLNELGPRANNSQNLGCVQ